MGERAVYLTRQARQDLLKLHWMDRERVGAVLRRLAERDYRSSRVLAGRHGLSRTRVGHLRAIWAENAEAVTVLRVRRRDVVYRSQEDLSSADQMLEPLIDEAASEDDEMEVMAESPRFQWHGQSGHQWHAFLSTAFRFAPVLSREQQQLYAELYDGFHAHSTARSGIWPIQSAPGTGKSICAALFAARLAREVDAYAALLVPPTLQDDIKRYHEVEEALRGSRE